MKPCIGLCVKFDHSQLKSTDVSATEHLFNPANYFHYVISDSLIILMINFKDNNITTFVTFSISARIRINHEISMQITLRNRRTFGMSILTTYLLLTYVSYLAHRFSSKSSKIKILYI